MPTIDIFSDDPRPAILETLLRPGEKATVGEFERLAGLIGKYKHRWNTNPSNRLLGWVDRYEALRLNFPKVHLEYTKKHGLNARCKAYDILA